MRKLTILLVVLCFTAPVLQAQNFETAYFLDNYSYSYRVNPAFHSEKNVYAALVGNTEARIGSKSGLTNFIFVRGGEIITGLSDKIPVQEFIANLQDVTDVNAAVGLNLATAGFWDRKHIAYHTIELNVKAYSMGNVPREMFSFLKSPEDRNYDIPPADASFNMYSEIAYGYSRAINSKLKIGGRAKIIIGLGQAKMEADHIQAAKVGDAFVIHSDARITASQTAIDIPLRDDGSYDLSRLAIIPSKISLPGGGFGFDLGISYEPVDGLETSIAINDLGGAFWDHNVSGRAVGTVYVDKPDSEKKEDILQSLERLVKFQPEESGKSSFEMLPFTANAGARYTMPFYKGLSAGLFLTYKNFSTSYVNARFGATITPVDWFSFTANYGYGSSGSSVGAAFSITGGIFNFFLGAESYLGRTVQNLPLPVGKFRTSIDFGITFCI